MKSYPIILLFLSLFVFSCTDNLSDIGSGIQPTSDQISIGTDTFHLTSETAFVDFVYSKPDSFLLGNYYNTKFGSTQADILAQVNCPVGFKFPPLSVPDSASVVLVYYSWYGNQYSPMDVNIYEMNKSTFSYSSLYPSNLDPTVYTDRSLKLSERIFTAKKAGVVPTDSNSVRFPLSPDFVQRFFNNTDFSSTSNFLKQFKGIYITANYGASTLLNVSKIYIYYYYHYTYTTKNVHGGDSIVKVNNSLPFPANSEVRQVNRFVHSDRAALVKPAANVNYVASPANLNTLIGIPLNRIQKRMDIGIANKKVTINSAMIKMQATNVTEDTVSAPTVRYMLLIKESAINRFFNNKELPSDTCAVLGGHANGLVAYSSTLYEDYYSFSVAKLIAHELKVAKDKNVTPVEKLNMRLIPVQVTFDTSGNITSVKHEYIMSAVTLLGAKDPDSPMRINVVYSGF
jgi:hypothetical protein